jgi:N-methylhydantoinase B
MADALPFDDPITFAVVKNAFDTIVDEMAYNVMRTARSHIVRDVLDYSTTLCDRDGCIIAQARRWPCIWAPCPMPSRRC